MDYNKINKLSVDGNGNIVLQDVKGENITVNYNDTAQFSEILTLANETLLSQIQELVASKQSENKNFEQVLQSYLGLPPEVRTAKEQIAQKVLELANFLHLMRANDSGENLSLPDNLPFDETALEELIYSIENGDCVLFLGPELSVDAQGNSLHENYFKSISDKSLFYNQKEGFFHPGNITKLKNYPPKFYTEEFPKLNKIGNALLQKLAQIPFKTIISYCPDDSMARIFSKFNIEHTFLEYNGTEIPTDDVDFDKTVLYNALGNLSRNSQRKAGKYILTHEDFDKYIRTDAKIKIPVAIESVIKDCSQFIFLGFNFDKWYFKLMLFLFDFHKDAKRHAYEEQHKILPENRSFIEKQFGIQFENSHYEYFVDVLLTKSREAGLSKSLNQEFVKNILAELETLRIKAIDAQKLEELTELLKKAELIENKIIENQK